MSNFICPTCGFTNIDCGKEGYKTDREIELEKKLEIAVRALKNIEILIALNLVDKSKISTAYKLSHQALAKIEEIK